VTLTRWDHLALLTLDRPDKLNSLTGEMIEHLAALVAEIESDDEIRCVILTGSGERAFSAGSDLDEVRSGTPMGLRLRTESPDIVRSLTKPVLAMINGYALGGGLELALACDIRIAADTATLGFPEITQGWLPAGGGGTQVLPRVIGEGRAMLLTLTGEPIGAAEAHRIGLVDRVVPAADLRTETECLAAGIARRPVEVLRLAKEAIRSAGRGGLEAGLGYERALNALAFMLRGHTGE
jgi:enoyl-CoA hydratase